MDLFANLIINFVLLTEFFLVINKIKTWHMGCNFIVKYRLIMGLLFFSVNIFAQKHSSNNKLLNTGEVFQCGFLQKKDDGMPNMLRIVCSKRTDAAIRLIDKNTDLCIRYAFLNRGDKYEIMNIPEGKYYVKVALGEDWFFQDSINNCLGGFKQNPIYKKLNNTFTFKKSKSVISSYELDLDVKKAKNKPSNEEFISLKEFQK